MILRRRELLFTAEMKQGKKWLEAWKRSPLHISRSKETRQKRIENPIDTCTRRYLRFRQISHPFPARRTRGTENSNLRKQVDCFLLPTLGAELQGSRIFPGLGSLPICFINGASHRRFPLPPDVQKYSRARGGGGRNE
jgi:hypothetical protein